MKRICFFQLFPGLVVPFADKLVFTVQGRAQRVAAPHGVKFMTQKKFKVRKDSSDRTLTLDRSFCFSSVTLRLHFYSIKQRKPSDKAGLQTQLKM